VGAATMMVIGNPLSAMSSAPEMLQVPDGRRRRRQRSAGSHALTFCRLCPRKVERVAHSRPPAATSPC
jgi:hypothetical protein